MKRTVLLAALLVAAAGAVAQSALPVVDVFKSPYCGCCSKWISHMEAAGFRVKVHDVQDTSAVRKQAGIPEVMGSCHTAKVGGYAIEGHVPAEDVKRLLKEKPQAAGLAVPGMPAGSPGMEGGHSEPYRSFLIGKDGALREFERH